jgi:hypothetical protein
VNAATIREAEKLIESCEHCNPEGAEIPFDNNLDSCVSEAEGRHVPWNTRLFMTTQLGVV